MINIGIRKSTDFVFFINTIISGFPCKNTLKKRKEQGTPYSFN